MSHASDETFLPWPRDARWKVGNLGTILGPSGRPTGSRHPQGYLVVAGNFGGGKRTSTTAHAMVCETYHGPRPAGQDACHEDGDPTNNRADNLRWDTRKGNQADRVRHHTNGHRLTNADVLTIRAGIASGISRKALAERFGVTPGMISHIHTGYAWKNLKDVA